jgi:FkbM family methyltransferase
MLLDGQVKRYHAATNPNLHEPVEEGWLTRLLADAPEACVFADVGAGIGYYSILARRLKPNARIFAVEPLPAHVEACAQNFALNDAHGVALREVAIAAQAGAVKFEDYRFGSRIARPGDRNLLQVDAITLDSFLEMTGTPVSVMKMDIQGEELSVLKSATSALAARSIASIVVGTHSDDLHDGVLELLRACGGSILFEDKHPEHQPDGIVVARFA